MKVAKDAWRDRKQLALLNRAVAAICNVRLMASEEGDDELALKLDEAVEQVIEAQKGVTAHFDGLELLAGVS